MASKTYKQSVKDFIAASPWLTPAHAPAVVTLETLAESLDKEISGPLVAQFNLTYRNLAKAAPTAAPVEDPLQALLNAPRTATTNDTHE